MAARMKEKYLAEVAPALQKKFGYKSKIIRVLKKNNVQSKKHI